MTARTDKWGVRVRKEQQPILEQKNLNLKSSINWLISPGYVGVAEGNWFTHTPLVIRESHGDLGLFIFQTGERKTRSCCWDLALVTADGHYRIMNDTRYTKSLYPASSPSPCSHLKFSGNLCSCPKAEVRKYNSVHWGKINETSVTIAQQNPLS